MQGYTPGPVGSGIPMGGPFIIYGAGETSPTAADMEPCLNKNLKIYDTGDVTGRFKNLVMCHLDTSLRNFILDKAERLWIVDWAWAGFFPPEFEMASLLHRRTDDPDFEFVQQLLYNGEMFVSSVPHLEHQEPRSPISSSCLFPRINPSKSTFGNLLLTEHTIVDSVKDATYKSL